MIASAPSLDDSRDLDGRRRGGATNGGRTLTGPWIERGGRDEAPYRLPAHRTNRDTGGSAARRYWTRGSGTGTCEHGIGVTNAWARQRSCTRAVHARASRAWGAVLGERAFGVVVTHL
ncbi:hypothetical protein GCM10022284_12880 [Streptomyces hundungensis]